MLYFQNNSKAKGFTLIELMVVISILGILVAIAIPNYIGFRNKAYCTEAETNADHIASAISDYYGMAGRVNLPTADDLDVDIANPVDIQGDPNTTISILVTDRTGRCPEDYQSAHANWSSDIFTKYVQ